MLNDEAVNDIPAIVSHNTHLCTRKLNLALIDSNDFQESAKCFIINKDIEHVLLFSILSFIIGKLLLWNFFFPFGYRMLKELVYVLSNMVFWTALL